MARDIWNISYKKKICEITANILYLTSFETFASNRSVILTITKPFNDKIGETFCEALKWMCKRFKKKLTKRLLKMCQKDY